MFSQYTGIDIRYQYIAGTHMNFTADTATRYEVGVDIGGTFTDVVCRSDNGAMRLVKIPTTRANPSAGVLHAVQHMVSEWGVSPQQIRRFVHGTTVATNAVLERKGAKIGLITTKGFRDVREYLQSFVQFVHHYNYNLFHFRRIFLYFQTESDE